MAVYDLEERLLDYSAEPVTLVDRMPNTKAGSHIGGQLLRSGTSPLANHGEAQAAESREDFIHKMKLCLKELRESHRWLRLIDRARLLRNDAHLVRLIGETDELIRIFVASIATARRRKPGDRG